MKHVIPDIVKKAAKELIAFYGDKFRYLGMYQGYDAFLFCIPDNLDVGYPHVYLCKNNVVKEITGEEALSISSLSSLC